MPQSGPVAEDNSGRVVVDVQLILGQKCDIDAVQIGSRRAHGNEHVHISATVPQRPIRIAIILPAQNSLNQCAHSEQYIELARELEPDAEDK